MSKILIEQDCSIEHDGQTFEAGGAVVTDEYVIGYMSKNMKSITTWHGDLITNLVRVTSRWYMPKGIMSSHMYQVRAFINDKWFTGRTMGDGMIVRLKPCKS